VKEGAVLQTLRFSCFALFLIFSNLLLAQDFSADVANAKQTGFNKIYATKDKLRIEGPGDRQNPMGPAAMVFDEAQNRWFVLFSQRHMYMDSLPLVMKKTVITEFWHVDDVDDACPQWKKLVDQLGTASNWGSCSRIGNDTVNGRSTVEYEGVSKQGEKNHFWVDRKLHCVIKTDSGGGFELRNIQEGSQPASLFEIPAGYAKVDLGALMNSQ
jgi:hypothetical protein